MKSSRWQKALVAAATAVLLAAPVGAQATTGAGTSTESQKSAPVAAQDLRVAASAGDPDLLVQAWYVDFLRRDGSTDNGRFGWVNRINQGQRPSDVLWSLTQTREYGEVTVGFTYDEFLFRAPDRGANYWVDGIASGRFPLEWAQQNILASSEYYSLWGSNNRDVVQGWYYDVLGRGPSAGDQSYWAGRIQRGGRLGALREIWYSNEAVDGRIAAQYQGLLQRNPSLGELAYWAPKMRESARNTAVLIASTDEYIDTFATY